MLIELVAYVILATWFPVGYISNKIARKNKWHSCTPCMDISMTFLGFFNLYILLWFVVLSNSADYRQGG